jgi:hypothetical protein
MKIFCPNCGSDNEGPPGGRVTCRACSATFDVPGDAGASTAGAPVQSAPPQASPAPTWNPPPQQPVNQARPWVPPAANYGQAPTTNTLAIVSLVTGLLSCACGCLGGLPAIITGVIAHNQINASGGTQTGKGLATAGIILGALGTVLISLLWVLGAIGSANQ